MGPRAQESTLSSWGTALRSHREGGVLVKEDAGAMGMSWAFEKAEILGSRGVFVPSPLPTLGLWRALRMVVGITEISRALPSLHHPPSSGWLPGGGGGGGCWSPATPFESGGAGKGDAP